MPIKRGQGERPCKLPKIWYNLLHQIKKRGKPTAEEGPTLFLFVRKLLTIQKNSVIMLITPINTINEGDLMKRYEDLHLNRCNVQVEDAVKEWYMFKAKSMGMSMSQLMSFVISNWYESHKNAEALQILAEISKGDDLKETNANTLEILKLIQGMDGSIVEKN